MGGGGGGNNNPVEFICGACIPLIDNVVAPNDGGVEKYCCGGRGGGGPACVPGKPIGMGGGLPP